MNMELVYKYAVRKRLIMGLVLYKVRYSIWSALPTLIVKTHLGQVLKRKL